MTTPGKLLTARFPGRCSHCQRAVSPGSPIRWAGRIAACAGCDPALKPPTAEELAERERAVERERAARAESLAASRAVDSAAEIPCPPGLTYLPFQRAGIAYARARPSVLIGDEMGLGKTIQALGLINADESIKRVLIVCPASLKRNWAREAETWLARSLPVRVVSAGESFPDPESGGITIVNYDILARFARETHEREWDLLIVDEAHFCKNPKARRTRAVCGGTPRKVGDEWITDPLPIPAKRRAFLTGTPLPNRIEEIRTLVRVLSLDLYRRLSRYMTYEASKYGGEWIAKDLAGLQRDLRETCMVRRLKSEVLRDLPAKRRQVIPVDPNGAQKVIERELAAHERIEAARRELASLSDEESDEAYRAAAAKLRAEERIAFTELSRVRHEVALAKAPHVAALAVESAAEHPLVVFAHHNDVVALIASELESAGLRVETMTQATPMDERQGNVERFQKGELDVIVGTIGTMGVGHTLTRSSHVIMAELDWVPGNVSQAEDRCHRIGQSESVLIQHVVFDGSLDSKMVRTLIAKQATIDAALDKRAVEHLVAAIWPSER